MARLRNAAHAEEKAEVEVLTADAAKYGELARKLRALQTSLEGGGRTVRDAIGPVHSNTREHQIMIHSKIRTCGLWSGTVLMLGLQTSTSSTFISTSCWSQDRTRAGKRESSELGISKSCC